VEHSFEEYVTARGQGLLRFAFVLSGDHHLAEDIVQEVLARLHIRWHRLEHIEQPDAYVRRAIVREYLGSRRRRASREIVLADPVKFAAEPDLSNEHAARDETWRLLAQLPRPQRAVLVLRFYEDLPDATIAEILGCTQVTVRVRASRGLARLRDLTSSHALTSLAARGNR